MKKTQAPKKLEWKLWNVALFFFNIEQFFIFYFLKFFWLVTIAYMMLE